MRTPYPFHQYPVPKFETTRHWHQRPSHIVTQPIVRMQFIVALVWSLCILVASL